MANELDKSTETKPETDKKEAEKKEEPKTPSTKELEDKIKQLESENGKLRQANTNASADASSWKKKYQDKLSEEDRKKEEQEEQNATLQKELETLRAERNVANFKSQLTAPDIGFDGDLAQEVAEAMNSGDTAKVFDGLRKFIVAHDKTLRENALRNNQTLQGGTSTKAITKEQFDAMGYKERLEVFNKHPDLYEEYTK
jgi:hypothetical protein